MDNHNLIYNLIVYTTEKMYTSFPWELVYTWQKKLPIQGKDETNKTNYTAHTAINTSTTYLWGTV